MKKLISLLTIISGLLIPIHFYAQVTIGSGNAPADGAILDMKQYDTEEAKAGGKTATKGLLLPRVELKVKNKLIMGNTEVANDSNGGDQYIKHAGLMVYNVATTNPFCPGLYTWNGTEWTRVNRTPCQLNTIELEVPQPLFFYNGQYGTSYYKKTVTLSWSPADEVPTWSYTPTNGLFASQTAMTPTQGWSTPQTLEVNPDPMTIQELTANPFLIKKSNLAFTIGSLKKEAEVKQENKTVVINGELFPPTIMLKNTQTRYSITAQSNATWKIENDNAGVGNSPIRNISQMTGGQDMEVTSTPPPTENISFDVQVSSSLPRYSFLTFSDTQSPKRYKDVRVSFAQCNSDRDLTLIEYRDLWEKIYGLSNGEEPNSNGNIEKNENQVQWHKDQSGNPFFSAMFGQDRWMITNLAATSYAPGAPSKPNLILGAEGGDRDRRAFYCYPGDDRYPIGDTGDYNKRQRIGVLYSWPAATATGNGFNPGEQWDKEYTPVQGICPDGWHLPSNLEWKKLLAELEANPLKYSKNTVGENTAVTARDQCEIMVQSTKEGLSFNTLDGGFSMLLAGMAASNTRMNFTDIAMYWTSTSALNYAYGYYAQIQGRDPKIGVAKNIASAKEVLMSVRCVANK